MKLLLLSEFFPTSVNGDFTGGVEARTFFIARELAKKHQVTVLCSYSGGNRSEQIAGFLVRRVGPKQSYTSSINLIQRVIFMFSAITDGYSIQADIVEGTNFITHIAAYSIGKIQRIPIIFWTPDVWKGHWISIMKSPWAIAGELLERFTLSRKGVYFIAISKSTAGKIIDAGVEKNRISVIPCGIEYSLTKKINRASKKVKTIIAANRLITYKHVDLLISAFHQILVDNGAIRLIIIGEGTEKSRLFNLTKKLGISNKVTFLGFLPKHKDILRLIASSYIFCSASTVEGFGIAALEAIACGTPAVLTDMPVYREIVSGKGSLFFRANDRDDLINKLQSLLTDKRLYKKLRVATKKQISDYDWSKIARRTEELYESVCTH